MVNTVPFVQQGQIWWADLPESPGSETERRHPVLVVQSDPFNRSAVETVVCVALADNWHLAQAPGNVVLTQTDSGLPKPAVASVTQLLTVNRCFLNEYVSTVPPWVLESVLDGVQLLFGR